MKFEKQRNNCKAKAEAKVRRKPDFAEARVGFQAFQAKNAAAGADSSSFT